MVKVDAKTDQGGCVYEELARCCGTVKRWGFGSAWLHDHFRALGNRGAQSRSIKIT